MTNIKIRFINEWKMQYEAVMMFIRCGHFYEAEKMVEDSL